MRSDMAKVICECYRLGDTKYNKVKGKKRRDSRIPWDEKPQKESMRKPYKAAWVEKEFGENLAPLFRYLEKQVGRNWDKVHSEICSEINLNNNVQAHILTHLYDFIETKVILIDGVACHGDGYSYESPISTYGHYKAFYVCPKTNIIKRSPKRKPYVREEADVIWCDKEKLQQYHCVDDVWYWVQLGHLYSYNNDRTRCATRYDVLQKTNVYNFYKYRSIYGGDWYAVDKRQLGKKELKKLRKEKILPLAAQ